MDRENLIKLRKILDALVPFGEPTEEELDYDDAAIELYHLLARASEALSELGY